MKCPYCNATDQSSVLNSRIKKKESRVWRRRFCKTCGTKYTTHEIPNFDQLSILNDSGKRRPFSRPKLFLSIYKACEALNGAAETADALTDTVLAKLLQVSEEQRTTEMLIDIVGKTLKHFDASVFVRYMSTHTSLSSSKELKQALRFYD